MVGSSVQNVTQFNPSQLWILKIERRAFLALLEMRPQIEITTNGPTLEKIKLEGTSNQMPFLDVAGVY